MIFFEEEKGHVLDDDVNRNSEKCCGGDGGDGGGGGVGGGGLGGGGWTSRMRVGVLRNLEKFLYVVGGFGEIMKRLWFNNGFSRGFRERKFEILTKKLKFSEFYTTGIKNRRVNFILHDGHKNDRRVIFDYTTVI